MTSPDYAHITVLADRTGSMGESTDPGRTKAMDTTAGIQRLIHEQASQPGKTTFSLVEFNYVRNQGNTPNIHRVAWFTTAADPVLASWECVPYGGTPLLDAVGMVLTETGQALAAMAEDQRPGRVFFVIATDGEENSSQEYTLAQVKDMITTQQEKYGWQIIYIGADVSAFSEAAKMGIPGAAVLQTNSVSSRNLAAAYGGTSAAMTRQRRGPSGQSVSYTATEVAEAVADTGKKWVGGTGEKD